MWERLSLTRSEMNFLHSPVPLFGCLQVDFTEFQEGTDFIVRLVFCGSPLFRARGKFWVKVMNLSSAVSFN